MRQRGQSRTRVIIDDKVALNARARSISRFPPRADDYACATPNADALMAIDVKRPPLLKRLLEKCPRMHRQLILLAVPAL